MTNLTARLYQTWKQAVLAGKVINQFEAVQDDANGRWAKGDRIIYGVKAIDNQLAYYAHNLSQHCDIQGAIAQKSIGNTGYLCRLNSYRALRPGAGNRPTGRQPDISAEPSLCRFHCQNREHPISLLRRDPLLSVSLTHFNWNAYYNVAPLETEGHFLWIPTDVTGDMPHLLQQLTPPLIEDAVQLFTQLSNTILFFNALHAGASVNHIHLQAVYHRQPLPIESALTRDYKGYQLLDGYLAQAVVFALTQTNQLTDYIEKLQQLDIPFNLAMLSDQIVVIARDGDQAIVPEFPGDGLAALGMCGVIATVNRRAFETVDTAMLKAVFQKMVIPASKIIDSFAEPIEESRPKRKD